MQLPRAVMRTVRAPRGTGSVVSSASREVDAIRRQLGDAVRDDRARKVDRLAAGADERQLSDGRQRSPLTA
jgi:hypothetical protein